MLTGTPSWESMVAFGGGDSELPESLGIGAMDVCIVQARELGDHPGATGVTMLGWMSPLGPTYSTSHILSLSLTLSPPLVPGMPKFLLTSVPLHMLFSLPRIYLPLSPLFSHTHHTTTYPFSMLSINAASSREPLTTRSSA